MSKPIDAGEERCERCGWPIVPEGEAGCWKTNCSMRPVPPLREVETARQADGVDDRPAVIGNKRRYLQRLLMQIEQHGDIVQSDAALPRVKVAALKEALAARLHPEPAADEAETAAILTAAFHEVEVLGKGSGYLLKDDCDAIAQHTVQALRAAGYRIVKTAA